MTTNKYICSACFGSKPCAVSIEQDHVRVPTTCVLSKNTQSAWKLLKTEIIDSTELTHETKIEARFVGDFCLRDCSHLIEDAEGLYCGIDGKKLDLDLGKWKSDGLLTVKSLTCKSLFK